MYTRRLKEKSH